MLSTLLKHKPLLVAVSVLALVATVVASRKTRAVPTGAATAQLLVDSPQSALANLKQNTAPLSTRAGVFAEFMASNDVRAAIAQQAHVPVSQIVASGPFDDPSTAPSGAAAPDPATGAVGPKPYILTYVAQETAPIVTVYAQAPLAAQAAKLADAAVSGVQAYVTKLQNQGQLPMRQRVIIRGLCSAQAGTVGGKAKMPLLVVAFIAVLGLGCFSILVFDGVSRRRA